MRGRLLVALQAVIFTVWSVCYPVAVAAATYNAAGPFTGNTWLVPMQGTVFAGSRIGAYAAVTLGRLNPWVNAAALGLGVGKMVLELKDGSTASLRADHAPVPAPPGWTDNPAAPWSPIPPPTADQSGSVETQPASAPDVTPVRWKGYSLAGCNSYTCTSCQHAGETLLSRTTGFSTCRDIGSGYWSADFVSPSNNTVVFPTCPSGSHAGTGAHYCVSDTANSCPAGWTLSGTNCTRPACPAGYSWNGTACALSDQNQVKFPPDGEQDFKISNNQIVPDPRSSDPTTITPSDIQNPGYTIFNDPYGNPIMHGFTPLSDGGFRFDQSVQLTNNGQTQTTQNSMTLNGTGNITNIQSTTYNGPITNTAGTPAVPSLQIPNDYNKEVTQQKILTGEGANSNPDFNADVTARKEAQDLALQSKLEELPGQFTADKGNWFSWVWTPPTGTCSPWVSTIHGQTVTWDLCPWISKIRDTIGFVGAVAGAWMVYCELFRREEL